MIKIVGFLRPSFALKDEIMDTLPILLRSNSTQALLIGNGSEAAATAQVLVQAKVRVTVISYDPSEPLKRLIDQAEVTHLEKDFEDSDLEERDLVVVADLPEEETENIVARVHRRHIPINVIEHPELSSFYFSD